MTIGEKTVRTDAQNQFSLTVPVTTGTNQFSVVSSDINGNSTTNTATFTVAVSGSTSFTYDLNGNTIDDGQRTYEWDGAGRVVAINYTGTNTRTEFSYDGMSRIVRINELAAGVSTSVSRFVWDGMSIAERRAADGVTLQKRYFAAGFQYSGTSGPENYFYVKDHLGSIRAIVDSGGVERGRWNYDLWGGRGLNQVLSGAVESDFGYTGHLEHSMSGLTIAPFRFYDAALGRWISRDPIGENGGLNLYGYVANNPINAVDPDGLDAVFLVGRNRKDPSYFASKVQAVAASYEQQSGQKAHVFEVRSEADIQAALATPNIDRLDYWGHGGGGALFLSEGDAGTLLSSEVASLNKSNVKPGAVMNLVSCYSSAGPNSSDGSDSIAQAFADHFLSEVGGFESGVSFGFPTKIGVFARWFPRGYVGVRAPGKSSPVRQGPTMMGYEN